MKNKNDLTHREILESAHKLPHKKWGDITPRDICMALNLEQNQQNLAGGQRTIKDINSKYDLAHVNQLMPATWIVAVTVGFKMGQF